MMAVRASSTAPVRTVANSGDHSVVVAVAACAVDPVASFVVSMGL
jgi:hypothetical protein